MNSSVRISTHRKGTMTLPSKSQKLTKNELESIKIAVKDVGLTAIHPEKMEAFAENMVEKLKNGAPKAWRTGSPLED